MKGATGYLWGNVLYVLGADRHRPFERNALSWSGLNGPTLPGDAIRPFRREGLIWQIGDALMQIK